LSLTENVSQLVGVSVVAFAIWAAVDKHHTGITLAVTTDAAYILIGLGASAAIISFVGCCGSVRQSTCMLATYATIVLLLVIGESVFVGLALTNTFTVPQLSTIWQEMSSEDRCSIQTIFKCRGFTNPGDHPAAMCDAHVYTVGCAPQFKDIVDHNLATVRGTLIGIAVFQFALFAMSVALACLAKKKPTYTRLTGDE
jgi:hypothetical protein